MSIAQSHFRRCSLSRLTHLTALTSLGLLLALSGCQKPADQAATSDSTTSSSPDSSPAGGASSGRSAVREAVAPKPLVVPAETTITVVLDESIGSKTSTTG